MFEQDITMLIISCDKFSDLWEGHIKMLNKFWPNRNFDAFIVSETNPISFGGAPVIACGTNLEWTERLSIALSKIKTEYVFLTLDDYFLVHQPNEFLLERYFDFIKESNIDYFRLFKRPKRKLKNRVKSLKGVYKIDNKQRYGVNLYSAIWRKDFLVATINEKKNAWQFEVSLPKKSYLYNANCYMTTNNVFQILDVVRKGKLLRKARRYFNKHKDIYNGARPTNSFSFEAKLFFRTWASRLLPAPISKRLRKFFGKHGYNYYSKEMDDM